MATYDLSNMTSIIYNGTPLSKVIYNGVTVWEDWKRRTGELCKVNNGGTIGYPYLFLNRTVDLGGVKKLRKASFRSIVVRKDIQGAVDCTGKIYGIKSDNTEIEIGSVTHKNTTTVFSLSNTDQEFTKVRYLAGANSEPHGDFDFNITFYISEWDEK